MKITTTTNILSLAIAISTLFIVACATPVTPPPSEDLRVVTLGSFEGSFDGTRFEIHAPHNDRDDVAGDVQALLPVVPSMGFAVGVEPVGVDYVALTAPTPRLTETTWDTTHCGPTPAGGVCMHIVMRNMFSRYLLDTPFVQFTSLTPTSPTTNVTFRSNATSNNSFGTSNAIGLTSYPPLLPAGSALDFRGAGVHLPLDRAGRWWAFTSTDTGPIRFTFRGDVKANPILVR